MPAAFLAAPDSNATLLFNAKPRSEDERAAGGIGRMNGWAPCSLAQRTGTAAPGSIRKSDV